jgi:hypothetical protein
MNVRRIGDVAGDRDEIAGSPCVFVRSSMTGSRPSMMTVSPLPSSS